VKFACDQCGRSYSVADELRGRTFKMKCKACGHLVVVKAAGAPGSNETAPPPREERPPVAPPISAPEPGRAPAEAPPAAPQDVNPFVVAPVSAAAVAAAVDALQAAPRAEAAPAEPEAPSAGAPSAGGGYIDLVLDEDGAAGRKVQAGAAAAAPAAPVTAAGGGFEDPFAGWKPFEGESAEKAVPPPLPRPEAATPVAGLEPEIRSHGLAAAPARPELGAARKVGTGPKAILAGGVAAAILIAVVVLATGKSGGGKGGPAAPRVPPTTPGLPVEVAAPAPPAPAPAPAPSEAAPAALVPAPQAATRAEPDAAAEERARRRASESRPKRERTARAAREERQAEPEMAMPAPAASAPPVAPAPTAPTTAAPITAAPTTAAPASPAPAGTAADNGPPSSDQVGRIVSANRKAFESCVAEAIRREPGLDLGGRQVVLMLTVNPSGTVVNPTLDDVELDKTDLGACLKSAARLMVFPAFEGPSMKVDVPLLLGRGG